MSDDFNQESLLKRWSRKPYLLIALALHVLLLLAFGTRTIFKALEKKKEFISDQVVSSAPPPPPPPPQQPQPPDETVPVPTQMAPPNEVIASDVLNPDTFTIPDATAPTIPDLNAPKSVPVQNAKVSSFAQRAQGIRDFTSGWGKDGAGPQGFGKSTQAQFVCYLAKANGIDPGIYHEVKETYLKGPIPNLMRVINAWSGGKITAAAQPTTIELSSQDLFKKKPPFVYFAGFADFKLTDAEVQNLRKYLLGGGAIWGDNGLAGKGSAFDLAFRREMKRVIPDADKQFEVLPLNHPIYGGEKSFFQLEKVPPGMNYRAEPTEAIMIEGDVAVIYTLNDYTDMMSMSFTDPVQPSGNQPELGYGEKANPFRNNRMNSILWPHHLDYFRNYEPESCEDSFRFGINIVVHLLTRFQDKLLFSR